MVVRSVRSNRNDGLQAFDTRGCGRQRNRAVVGRSRHATLARAPERFDFFVLIRRRETFRSAIQPVDHSFRCQ